MMLMADGEEICPHHLYSPVEDGWAESNRIMCNFFHRQVIPKRIEHPINCPTCQVPMEDGWCQACYNASFQGGGTD